MIYPVKDIAQAKTLFSKLLGVEPYMDEAYYVGFRVGDQDIGLDAVADAAEREAAEIRRGVEVRHERLQRMPLLVPGAGTVVEGAPRRAAPGRRPARSGSRVALPGSRVAVEDRELDLMVLGVQVQEQLVHLVDDLGDASVRPVDLVHDQDHRQVRLERLAQDEARLRQRALAGVDSQEHAVDHRQAALDLPAEVGVDRGVDDVDLRVAVANGGVLREDRDALLAFEVDGVHDAFLTSWFSRNAPDCHSIASTSVVLPWST